MGRPASESPGQTGTELGQNNQTTQVQRQLDLCGEVKQLFMTPAALASVEGLSFEHVVQTLGNKYSRDDLKRYIDELCDQGALYSTNDDHHFRSTAD